MILRPLLLALLMSAAAGAASAHSPDDPELAGGPPSHAAPPPGDERMGSERMNPDHMPRGAHGSRDCFRRDDADPDGPASHRWRRVPCPPPHAMEGMPPPGFDMPLPPPSAWARGSNEYYERGEWRSYDSRDPHGYGSPPPGWRSEEPPPEGPPLGYGPYGDDQSDGYAPPDDGYLHWPDKNY